MSKGRKRQKFIYLKGKEISFVPNEGWLHQTVGARDKGARKRNRKTLPHTQQTQRKTKKDE